MSFSHEQLVPPQSFLLTRTAWLAGTLSLSQLWAIPRRPEVIGRILPMGFDQDQGFDFDAYPRPDRDYPPRDILRGAPFNPNHPGYGRFAYILEHGFRPALQQIYQHATGVMGVDLSMAAVSIRTQCLPGDKLRRTFGISHLDVHERDNTLLAYSVANRASTAFPIGPFEVPDDVDLFEDQRKIERLLREQRDGQRLFQAEPYQITMFDETMPHEVPPQLKDDPRLRTFLRVWLEQPRISDAK